MTLNDLVLYDSTEKFTRKSFSASAANLAPGTYTFRVEIINSAYERFTKELTGLRVLAAEEILDIITSVTAATLGRPPVLNFNFQSSGSGRAILLIVEPGPPPRTVMEQPVIIDVGRNSVSLDMISNVGGRLPRGVYEWKMVYKGAVKSGVILVP